MKRTPLKRKTALKRKTPLKARRGINRVGKMANPIPQDQRERIYRRANYRCQICGSTYMLGIAHNPSKKMGGTKHIYTDEELILLCVKCHGENNHHERVTIDSQPLWNKQGVTNIGL